jgi:hypothetical protein
VTATERRAEAWRGLALQLRRRYGAVLELLADCERSGALPAGLLARVTARLDHEIGTPLPVPACISAEIRDIDRDQPQEEPT